MEPLGCVARVWVSWAAREKHTHGWPSLSSFVAAQRSRDHVGTTPGRGSGSLFSSHAARGSCRSTSTFVLASTRQQFSTITQLWEIRRIPARSGLESLHLLTPQSIISIPRRRAISTSCWSHFSISSLRQLRSDLQAFVPFNGWTTDYGTNWKYACLLVRWILQHLAATRT